MWLGLLVLAASVIPQAAQAVPEYTVTFVASGATLQPKAMSEQADIAGDTSIYVDARAFVIRAGVYQLLPLPPGFDASKARDISDSGVVVGTCIDFDEPGASDKPIAWYPIGGGYEAVLISSQGGSAVAVNSLDQIVGSTVYNGQGTDYVYTRETGITPIEIPGPPVDINDHQIVLGGGVLLDLTTGDLTSLPGDPNFSVLPSLLNNNLRLAGLGIGSGTYNPYAIVRSDTLNGATVWERLTPFWDTFIGPTGLNDAGDLVGMWHSGCGWSPLLFPADGGSYCVGELLRPEDDDWQIGALDSDINNLGQIAARGYRPSTGQSGIVVLSPDAGPAGLPLTTATPAGLAQLRANHPEPFSETTTIRFELREEAKVRMDVCDVSGRLVVTLLDQPLAAGSHDVRWDGRDGRGRTVPSGVYYCRLRCGEVIDTRKLTLGR